MCSMSLKKPSMKYDKQIAAFRKELLAANEDFDGCNGLRKCETTAEWLEYLETIASEQTCPKGLVPSDTFIFVREEDDCPVGMIDVRRHIDHPILSVWGGHIGYSVRPSERRKGYAVQMLAAALQFCRENGQKRVLITCNVTNVASEKTILANGGVYEKDVEVDGRRIKRFWVSL